MINMAGPGYLLILATIIFPYCSQRAAQRKPNAAAINLNNKALVLLSDIKNADSNRKAIQLLDSATMIDSNYSTGYYNKLIFLNQTNQPEKSLSTISSLIRLNPAAHEYYMYAGMMYEKMGDAVRSDINYKKSLTICTQILDTMSLKNRDYFLFGIDKAVNLILTGEENQGNALLEKMREMEPSEEKKKVIESLMNKDKTALFKQLAGEPKAK